MSNKDPERLLRERNIEINYNSLDTVIEKAKKLNIPFSKISIETQDLGEYSPDYNSILVYSTLETDEEYEARMSYLKSLSKETDKIERQEYLRLKNKYG